MAIEVLVLNVSRDSWVLQAVKAEFSIPADSKQESKANSCTLGISECNSVLNHKPQVIKCKNFDKWATMKELTRGTAILNDFIA